MKSMKGAYLLLLALVAMVALVSFGWFLHKAQSPVVPDRGPATGEGEGEPDRPSGTAGSPPQPVATQSIARKVQTANQVVRTYLPPGVVPASRGSGTTSRAAAGSPSGGGNPRGAANAAAQSPAAGTQAPTGASAQSVGSSGSRAGGASDPSGGLAPAAPGQSGAAAAADPIELNIEVPFGAKVPAAAVDDTPGLTAPQKKVMQQILVDFQNDVAAAPDNLTTWEQARAKADDRYRVIFGDAAYNQMSTAAALEALQEKRSTTSP